MSRMLVLYYSTWGHVESLAHTVAEGARSVSGTEVDIKRVPETMAAEKLAAMHAKTDQSAAIAEPGDLARYDAIVFGTPTRFGNMAAQMRNFLDQTGSLWQAGQLVGKIGSVFVSTATQHGGQESTLLSFYITLLHHGMVLAGVPYTCPELSSVAEVAGGSPYGAGTIAGGDGSRRPNATEQAIARFQGQHVAKLAAKLARP